MGSLRDLSLDYLIDNKEVGKLFFLLNTNKLTHIQRNKILALFLTDIHFIKLIVEENPTEFNNSKYKDSILTLYDLVTNEQNIRDSNYIKRMTSFNENDEAFLWFILYQLLFGPQSLKNKIPDSITSISFGSNYNSSLSNMPSSIKEMTATENLNKVYISNMFHFTNYVKKMVGVIRIKEFGLNINDYVDLWNLKINSYAISFDNGEYLFSLGVERGLKTIESRFTYDYKFSISSKKNYPTARNNSKICESIEYVKFNLFKYDDKYYVDKYMESLHISTNCKINMNKAVEENPYISSVSKNLMNILPFIKGEVDYIKCYSGKIIDGEYVITNNYDNKLKISFMDLSEINREYLFIDI